MKLHFFSAKEATQIEPYHLIVWVDLICFGCQWAGVWVHINKKHGGWTSYRARRFNGRLGKLFFWGKKVTISSVWLLQHAHFVNKILLSVSCVKQFSKSENWLRCVLGRTSMERDLKEKDKLLQESERKAKCLEEEYENLDLYIMSGLMKTV